MEYIEKYKKYREKYKKLLSKLNGGYFLGDKSHESFFLPRIERNLSLFPNYPDGVQLFSKPKGDRMFDIKKLITIFNSPEYLELYQHLINEFLDNSTYTQRLSTTKGLIEIPGVYKYHINFGSIIFLSFMLELELFSLVHIMNGYNIVKPNMTTIQNESCPSIFPDGVNMFRFYKSLISENNIFSLSEIFTLELDRLFSFFMRRLIRNLSKEVRRPIKESVLLILTEIIPDVPRFTYEDYQDNENITLYKFIYVNWKIRLLHHLGIQIETINGIIEMTINEIQDKDAQYIAEGTGFFSFIFLGHIKTQKRHYGSCITYSILEFYIMSRLHTNGNNMKLILENQDPDNGPHEYWRYTQDALKKNFSHWSTRFTLITGNINFRSVDPQKTEVSFIKPDTSPNELFLKALIFPIFDSYNQYIECYGENEWKRIIKKFIDNRSRIINSLLNREPISLITDIPSYQEIITELKNYKPKVEYLEYLKDIPIDEINNDRNEYGQNLLYYSARNGNIVVVNALIDLPGINLNIRTSRDGSTALHGAAFGFEYNYFKNQHYRTHIIELLISKGASQYISNDKGESYRENIRM